MRRMQWSVVGGLWLVARNYAQFSVPQFSVHQERKAEANRSHSTGARLFGRLPPASCEAAFSSAPNFLARGPWRESPASDTGPLKSLYII